MKLVQRATAVFVVLFLLVGLAVSVEAGGAAAHAGKVNVNTASETELTKLPGIGPAKARAIVEYRQENPFKSVDELKQVSGIGEHTMGGIRDQITVGPRN